MIIGLTGGIGSGKSTAAAIFKEMGCVHVDADRISRALTSDGSPLLETIERRFGPGLVREGRLDRKALADIVFSDAAKRDELNDLIHAIALKKALTEIKTAQASDPGRHVIFDVPLLFEAGWDAYCDMTVTVTCPEDVRIARVEARSGLTADDIRKRIAAQMSDAERAARSDEVIDNSGSPEYLKEQVEKLLSRLNDRSKFHSVGPIAHGGNMKYVKANLDKLNALFDKVMKDSKAQGIAMSVFDAEGNIILDRFEGYRDSKKKLPLNENTVMGLASITKSFTSVSIMQLVEQGKIDLYAPICKYIPEFKNKDMLVYHLLFHSAGFHPMARHLINDVAKKIGVSYEKDGELAYNVPLSEYGAKELVKIMNEQTDFTGAPGQNFSYSNHSFALLSELVRLQGGEPTYADYVKKHVLLPLGMTRSGCDFVWNDDNVTTLYYQDEKGVMHDEADFYDNAFVLNGEGNMRSTIADMRKYVRMYLNYGLAADGTKVADSYSIEQITRPHQSIDLNVLYGFGLTIEPKGPITIVGHGGNLTGVASRIAWSYELGAGVVIISNTSSTPVSSIAVAALMSLAGLDPDDLLKTPEPIYEWSEAEKDSICGRYWSSEGIELKIVKDGDAYFFDLDGQRSEISFVNKYDICTVYNGFPSVSRMLRNPDGSVWAIGTHLRIVKKVE